jgi:desulfoferrodoxin (superoxide reductase-like protein)
MQRLKGTLTVLLVLLLAGCAVGPATYQGPAEADQNAAVVAVGAVSENYPESHYNSWIQIVAVDGESTGLAPWVRVPPGDHKFTIRHHDPYATFHGNIKYESVSFRSDAGGRYRIEAAYCCGFILGQFDLWVIDEASGQQIADSSIEQ